MIGIDTNILVRIVARDDPEQTMKAVALLKSLSEQQPGYVNLLTLAEFWWTLRSRLKQEKTQILEMIGMLLNSREILLEDEPTVEQALQLTAEGRGDFPDLLIALRNQAAGCARTVTFDRKAAAAIPGMEVLA
jgi:predicted nucleic-acid-binding protein